MKEFVPCEKCRGKNGNYGQLGYIKREVLSKDGIHKQEVLEECECHVKWRSELRLESLGKRANLNLMYMDYSPEKDYLGEKSKASVDRLLKYKELFLDETLDPVKKDKLTSSVIYLYGKNGTQKTSIANYLGFEFLRGGKTVQYCLMNNLIKKLQKADFENDDSLLNWVERLSTVDLLILDESFDKEKITLYRSNFQIPFLDTFLRSRIQEHHKGIFFISNVDVSEIEANGFSHSIQDLVQRNVGKNRIEMEDVYNDLRGQIDEEALF